MKRNLGTMVIASFVFQYLFYYNANILNGLQFLKGVPITDSFSTEAMYLMAWYFPIFFILMFFSGYTKKNFVSQGIAFIVRNESKFKLSMKGLIKVSMLTLLLVLFQSTIYLFNYPIEKVEYNTLILSLVIYYLFLLCAVSVLSYLDLYMPSQISFISVNVLILAGTLVSKFYNQSYKYLDYFNIISNSMGYRNGLGGNSSYNFLNPLIVIFITISMIIFIQILSWFKVKKMDII
ncbi:DUF2705 family protein [Alkalihalobacillus sp. LMS39]|uniref:DUF2705 family protein n=1 Tax=Alkalihalobacillus sp. LMS39 TaxID=2924032 RepID=UPI001FB3E0DE|nr:DUF2705 family protein [Alkalihalobacillus sp. LMS39]UOE94411.1 DUF2705 family protein [Alkalihalobacillus sp. LMS39]